MMNGLIYLFLIIAALIVFYLVWYKVGIQHDEEVQKSGKDKVPVAFVVVAFLGMFCLLVWSAFLKSTLGLSPNKSARQNHERLEFYEPCEALYILGSVGGYQMVTNDESLLELDRKILRSLASALRGQNYPNTVNYKVFKEGDRYYAVPCQ